MAVSGVAFESLAGGGALEGLEAGLAFVRLCRRVLIYPQEWDYGQQRSSSQEWWWFEDPRVEIDGLSLQMGVLQPLSKGWLMIDAVTGIIIVPASPGHLRFPNPSQNSMEMW